MTPLSIAPRLRLDVGLGDLVAGLAACATARSAAREERRLLEQWGLPGEGVACLSVRSAFDLLLTAMRLPAGSDVAFTAITHPDMPLIARAHDLRVVPLDVDVDTLAPTPAALTLIGPATRLVVVAHLFGGRVGLGALAERAHRHGALLVEDCAQALRGPVDHGDARADVSLFSFGSIKTATALGGALVRVADPTLREALLAARSALRRQSRRAQAAKLLKFSGFVLLGHPVAYGSLLRVLAVAGRDPDAFVNGVVKAFPHHGGDERDQLLRRIRRAPSAPLLALINRRLRRFDGERLARRASLGEWARRSLPDGARQPGRLALERTHWVFPVLVEDPVGVVGALRREGVDAARATTSIDALAANADGRAPVEASELIEHVVFLPVYPELDMPRLRRHLDALRRATATTGPGAERVAVPGRS